MSKISKISKREVEENVKYISINVNFLAIIRGCEDDSVEISSKFFIAQNWCVAISSNWMALPSYLIMGPDRLRINIAVFKERMKADIDMCRTISLSIVVRNQLITIFHISKGLGDLLSVCANIQVVMTGMGTPACSDFENLAILDSETIVTLFCRMGNCKVAIVSPVAFINNLYVVEVLNRSILFVIPVSQRVNFLVEMLFQVVNVLSMFPL